MKDSNEKQYFDGSVLIVEDNIMNQEIICELLADSGLKIFVAENGKIAVDIVMERFLHREKPFDLIFMDITMPVLGGLPAAEKIKSLGIETPIIAMTADTSAEDIAKYREYGLCDCLGKPFKSQELWRILYKHFSKKRLHFGVLFSTIDNTCQYDIWNGIADFARKNDIHLTGYIGSYQTSDYDYASHFDTCFDKINHDYSLDGVIMFSGFIAQNIGNEKFDECITKLPKHIPFISVSYIVPDIPSVLIDNITGVYNAVEHLIKEHGKKHIAFVKGPDGHNEAEDRLEGYKRALEANGIAFDERYVFPGNFSQDDGVVAAKMILSKPDLVIDAIAACDDETAIGILTELKNRDIKVPADIAVVGFDDDRASATFIPSISTARQDFYEIGEKSAETLLNKLNGTEIDDITYVSPVFITRQSCGCVDDMLLSVNPDDESTIDTKENLLKALVAHDLRYREGIVREFAAEDHRLLVRRITGSLVLKFDIDTLMEEIRNSLPELSINIALIGLYHNPVANNDPRANRSISTFLGFDGENEIKAYDGFDFEKERRELLFFPLFFKDEEIGIILLPFSHDISVDTYETLRINISTAIKGAVLLSEANAANKAKSEFLSNVSHEIRTPMNSIMGFADLAMESDNLPQIRNYLGKITDNTKWLLTTISDILDISKIESGKMEIDKVPFDLNEVISRCQSVILPKVAEKGLELKIKADSITGKKLLGDPVRLYQTLNNLLSNAVKFTETGVITLLTRIKRYDDKHISAYFEVKDTGIGIAKEQLHDVFNPFVQADSGSTKAYGGTGLGLPITANIVDLMGGRLKVTSKLGAGSTFKFEIMFETSDMDDAMYNIKSSSIEKPFFDGIVLVCDDNSMNQQVMSEHLNGVGLKVVIAVNGKVGVEMVKERIDKGEPPFDLILMDVFMPVMSGVEAAVEITALNTGTPIIAVTANTMASELESYRKHGMPDYLSKPFSSQELWSLLLKYLTPVSSKLISEEEEDTELLEKLKIKFIKTNVNKFKEISDAINTDDIELAHRLVHSLKGNAGFIGKTALQNIAGEIEDLLETEDATIPEAKMEILEKELTSVLNELKPYQLLEDKYKPAMTEIRYGDTDDTNKSTVLVVDDEDTNIMILMHMLDSKYRVFASTDGADAIIAAEKIKPDIILLDLVMPVMDGYQVLSKLKSSRKTKDIPVILVTSKTDAESEVKGLGAGAIDYILKPYKKELLLQRLELHLQLKRYNSDLEKEIAIKSRAVYEMQGAMLETVAELVESRDNITGGHISRTQSYLKLLVELALDNGVYADELSTWDIDLFVMSSQLHDVGKISISDSILMKPGKLTDEEFSSMKDHTSFGRDIIKKIEVKTKENAFLEHARLLAVSHHEKWNGFGYPHGLKGEDIPLQGRLMAIVDVYDALTNVRPYKKAFTHEEALEIIKEGNGSHFDPLLCDIFIKYENEFKVLTQSLS